MIDIALKIIIILFLAVLVFVIAESSREFKNFRIKRYSVHNHKIPKSFDGYKLAVIGDLHNFHYSEDNSEIISCLEKENPDAVILVGDMVLCRKKAEAENLEMAGFVNKLADRFMLAYGIGNHEKGLMEGKDDVGDVWQRYAELLSEKVWMMSNERVYSSCNNERIAIYGLDIDRYFYTRLKNIPMGKEYLTDRLGKCTDGFNILIAHNPDYFEDYADWGADLVLSGHIHGGMVRLPFLGGVISPKLKIFPKYDYGYFEKKGRKMIITGGLGGHSPRLRVNNPPEIVMIELKSDSK